MNRRLCVLAVLPVILGTVHAASDIPPLDISVHLEGQGTEHLTANGSDLVCDGGRWQFDWAGKVPGESADAQALLSGDAMYYTSNEHAGWTQRPSLRGVDVDCSAPEPSGQGRSRAFRGQIQPGRQPGVDVQMSMASANPYLSFSAHDVATCTVEMTTGSAIELPVDLMLSLGSAVLPSTNRFTPALALTREEVEQGFDKTWQVSSDYFLPSAAQCAGQRMTGAIRVRFKVGADDPEINFDGCLNLARGEKRTVFAQGKPSGGSYRFAATPGSMMRISHAGATSNQADVVGASPGRGEFTATYARRGKKADKTVTASVVEVSRLGDGSGEIEMGLMDAEGRPVSKPLRIPIGSDPPEAGDLLIFKADKPDLLSIATGRSDVTVQAVAPGTAEIRAQTLCGTPLGPSLKVHVVRCDKATRDALERRKNSLKERTQAILRQVADILNDDEFNRVEKEIKDDTYNLWIKASESIVGTLSLGQGQRLKSMETAVKAGRASEYAIKKTVWLADRTKGIEAAGQIYDIYDTSMDVMEGMEAATNLKQGHSTGAEAYDGMAKGALAALAFLIDNEAVGLGKSYAEAAMAAEKMGQNLGTMLGAADRLADLDVQHANVLWEAERVGRFIKRCDAKSDQPEARKPGKRKSRTKEPRQQADEQPVEATPAETTSESPPKDEIIDRKPSGPRRMSLPMCAAAKPSRGMGSSIGDGRLDATGGSAALTPKTLSQTLRVEKQEMDALANRLRERAATARGIGQWATAMRAALAQDAQALRPQLPALRQQLEQAILNNANAGDATLDDMESLQSCAQALPERTIDLKSLKWHFGP